MKRTIPSTPSKRAQLPPDYREFLESLKQRVQNAQTKAMLSVNRELIQLYWDVGRQIVERQQREGWGAKALERLADDLQKAFPGVKGFSRSNVFRMRAFFKAYCSGIVAQAVRQLPDEKVAQAVRQLPGEENIAQPARELPSAFPSQAVTELDNIVLPQAVAEIP